MENRQTAVEWLELRLKKKFDIYGDKDDFKEMFQQAKAMEQKEHSRIASKAREDGWKEGKYGVSRW
jgi:hypothetical protein